jgi:hypothetical protein
LTKLSTRARGNATVPLGRQMIAMLPEQCAPSVSARLVRSRTELCCSGDSPRNTKPLAFGKGQSSGTKEGQTRLLNSSGSSMDEVIRLVQRGDLRAFEHIYRLHFPRVYALCLRLVRDPVEAEDFAQDVFMQLFRKIHTFRASRPFLPGSIG